MRNSRPDTIDVPFTLSDLSLFVDQLLERHSITLLRASIGVVFLWFGLLKFIPAASPAEEIAVQTISVLTLDLIPARVTLIGLATFESALGLCFVTGRLRRYALPLLCMHMLGTVLPLLFFPHLTFSHAPYAPTLEGQYILKNMIILGAAAVLQRRWR